MVISEEVQNALVDAAAALLDGGDLRIKEGSTVFFTFALKNPAFAAAASGSADLDVTDPIMEATASGTATTAVDNYEFRTSGGDVRLSGDVGEIDSGAEIELNHTDVELNDVLVITDYALSIPTGA